MAARERIERWLRVPSGASDTDAWSMLVRIQSAQGDLAGANASFARLSALDPAKAATLRGGPTMR